jgi:hypothetical protein
MAGGEAYRVGDWVTYVDPDDPRFAHTGPIETIDARPQKPWPYFVNGVYEDTIGHARYSGDELRPATEEEIAHALEVLITHT